MANIRKSGLHLVTRKLQVEILFVLAIQISRIQYHNAPLTFALLVTLANIELINFFLSPTGLPRSLPQRINFPKGNRRAFFSSIPDRRNVFLLCRWKCRDQPEKNLQSSDGQSASGNE